MEKKKEKKVLGGLNPTPPDERDFPLGAVYGNPDIPPLVDFEVAEQRITDQEEDGVDDGCTGYALAGVLEGHEGVPLDPGFLFAMIKRAMGRWEGYGGDLRSGCKVAVEVGAAEVGDNPSDFSGKGRDFIANWKNWALDILLPKAQKHRQASFFRVTGKYDRFDNARAALWAHRDSRSLIYTGVVWRDGWLRASGGVIRGDVVSAGTPHCIRLSGQKVINGVPYIVVPNSYGTDVGDQGKHYFSRETFNREFTFGEFIFKDIAPEKVKEILVQQGIGPYAPRGFWATIRSWFGF